MTDYYYLDKISLGDDMKKFFKLDNIIQVIISLFIGASLYLKYLIGYDGKYPFKFIKTFHFNFKFFIVVIVLGSFTFLLMKLAHTIKKISMLHLCYHFLPIWTLGI